MNTYLIDKEIRDAASYCVRVHALENPLSPSEAEGLCIECAEFAYDKKGSYNPNNAAGATLFTWSRDVIDKHLLDRVKHLNVVKRAFGSIRVLRDTNTGKSTAERLKVLNVFTKLSDEAQWIMDSWMDGWTFAEMADVSCCSERTMYRRWDDAKKGERTKLK